MVILMKKTCKLMINKELMKKMMMKKVKRNYFKKRNRKKYNSKIKAMNSCSNSNKKQKKIKNVELINQIPISFSILLCWLVQFMEQC
jgi:hypothetical protein